MTRRVGDRVTFTRWSPFDGPQAITGTVESIEGDLARVRIEQAVLITKPLEDLFDRAEDAPDS